MNRYRKEVLKLVEGDKVWLKLGKQFLTGRDSKKLDWKNAKYIIKKIINLYLVKLNTSKNLNDAFHVDKLHLANTDPLLSQPRNNTQPPPIQEDEKEGFVVEDIMAEMKNKKGRGWKKQYEVKWKGYA